MRCTGGSIRGRRSDEHVRQSAGPPQAGRRPLGGSAAALRGRGAHVIHSWLLSDRPQSRRQAALGRAYAAWRTFARNRLAVAGLVTILLLVLAAVIMLRVYCSWPGVSATMNLRFSVEKNL